MSNQLSWTIVKQFSGKNEFGFTFQDVVREFPVKNRIHLSRVLADMVDKGMLCKIARDNYHIIPLNADPETYIPEMHQVAKHIMQKKEYYIGYASALAIHGLTFHSDTGVSEAQAIEVREYVVTTKQKKPSIWNIKGRTYQFIQHDASRFFGFDSIWINQLEQAMVSDLERTIVDIATKPQYSGGIIVVGHAIFQTRDRTDKDKLFYYFARNLNKSAKKRFLFLTDLLDLEWTVDHEKMMDELGHGLSLLDPGATDRGRIRSKFGLKINVDPQRIQNEVLHRNNEPSKTT